MTQPLQYIIVEGRRPQNGDAPMRATIIFDARLSPVGMTAGRKRYAWYACNRKTPTQPYI